MSVISHSPAAIARRFIITSTNPENRARVSRKRRRRGKGKARVNVTLDKLRAARVLGHRRRTVQAHRYDYVRARRLKSGYGNHVRNICKRAGEQLRFFLLRREASMGKNVTLFSYMVMQHAAHLENLSSYTVDCEFLRWEGGYSLYGIVGVTEPGGYRSTRDG